MVHPVIFALSLLCLNLFIKIARYQWLSLILILNPDKPGWQKTQWTNGFFSCFSFLFSALQIVTLPPLKSKFKTNNFLFRSKQGWNFFKSVPNFLQMVFQMFQIFEYLFLHYTLYAPLYSDKDLTGRSQRWGWIYNSILGLLGTFLNGYVLYVFIRNIPWLTCIFSNDNIHSERHSMITSVNAMIW